MSSRYSLIKAATATANTGASHSSTTDARSLGRRRSIDFMTRAARPGPATWTAGTYPNGQADFPVGGVSWYEAAAYAAFAGKSLPTIYHWYRAADLGRFADILTLSNFNAKGPVPVGSLAGLGPFGTSDMAGNVKEWCWNATERGRIPAWRSVERAPLYI